MHYLKFFSYCFSSLYAWEKNNLILHREGKCFIDWFSIHSSTHFLSFISRRKFTCNNQVSQQHKKLLDNKLSWIPRDSSSHILHLNYQSKTALPKVSDKRMGSSEKLLYDWYTHTHMDGWMISWDRNCNNNLIYNCPMGLWYGTTSKSLMGFGSSLIHR